MTAKPMPEDATDAFQASCPRGGRVAHEIPHPPFFSRQYPYTRSLRNKDICGIYVIIIRNIKIASTKGINSRTIWSSEILATVQAAKRFTPKNSGMDSKVSFNIAAKTCTASCCGVSGSPCATVPTTAGSTTEHGSAPPSVSPRNTTGSPAHCGK